MLTIVPSQEIGTLIFSNVLFKLMCMLMILFSVYEHSFYFHCFRRGDSSYSRGYHHINAEIQGDGQQHDLYTWTDSNIALFYWPPRDKNGMSFAYSNGDGICWYVLTENGSVVFNNVVIHVRCYIHVRDSRGKIVDNQYTYFPMPKYPITSPISLLNI